MISRIVIGNNFEILEFYYQNDFVYAKEAKNKVLREFISI